MSSTRSVAQVFASRPTLEGAGVHLKRGFSHGQETLFDPFLLFDDFSGDDPADFIAGFPWHPHRGIETITYLLEGEVEHGDSLGNAGSIRPGDVQWMTAGSGIIHQEMPVPSPNGKLVGFQLWANLPASHKMIAPRYRGITASEIPQIHHGGARVHVICGTLQGHTGPAQDIIIAPEYLDVSLDANGAWLHATPPGHTAFAYLFAGTASFAPGAAKVVSGSIVLFNSGDQVEIAAGDNGARFLFITGKPLREPIAWGGPIVMNTAEELRTAFAEFRAGTFIKHPQG
ncbi:pirin family protein [Levilinea saccharolytica]|uniref:Pirin n=1 Tax=Levilinea saccharolytica TaxID=229921 RepID=A0A0N8GR85_9CHLR|nr:pirin family protein [Levilinea saccharolytica]KPL85794.1 pirin [Levilinea saccharolytica]GAP16753.1 pirin-related protein [Levilinea saccharolytica]